MMDYHEPKDISHSIVIVSYNHVRTIREAFECASRQTKSPAEIVLLDDCSNDGTEEILKELKFNAEGNAKAIPVKVIINPRNMGIAYTLKAAATHAIGEIVTILGGDDLLSLETVEKINAKIVSTGLRSKNGHVLTISPVISIDKGRETIVKPYLFEGSIFKTAIRKSAPIVRVGVSRNLLLESYYPGHLGTWADWAWDVDLASRCNTFIAFSTPFYTHRPGYGVSNLTPERELINSYREVALYILKRYRMRLDLASRLFLYQEILRSKLRLIRSYHLYPLLWILLTINIIYLFGRPGTKNMLAFLLRKTK